MSGDPNHLEKAVRESLASLSDFELIWRSRSPDYTEFARQSACEELEKRRRVRAAQHSPPQHSSDVEDLSSGLSPIEAGGCYVDLWRDKGYEGEHVRIDGAGEVSDLRVRPEKWGSEISSLRVGPCAFVEVYADEGLIGNMVCFGPNQEVPDLSEIELDHRLGSIKIISSTNIFDGLGSASKVEEYKQPVHEMLKRQKRRDKRHKQRPPKAEQPQS